MDKLLDFQKNHTQHLISVLKKEKIAIDTSDTGTGKTYIAMAICREMGLHPLIICPKAVISVWFNLATDFGVELLGVSNYESIKVGSYYDSTKKKSSCPYTTIFEDTITWKLPSKTIVIFDEVHKCKNPDSQNGQLLTSLKTSGVHILLLSATIADRPEYFANFAYMLDICNSVWLFKYYLKAMESYSVSPMSIIHHRIYPKYGSRLRISELGDKFPDNQIVTESYTMDESDRIAINEQYEELWRLTDSHKTPTSWTPDVLRIQRIIESRKMTTFVNLARDHIENGLSVVIFVNFHQNMEYLCKHLHTQCVIHGRQSLEERDSNVKKFQDNQTRIIICQIQSGGASISLHDVHGGHPRVSLISPTWSGQDLVQALGRIHRADGKSPCLQRIVFCSGTQEDKMCQSLREKLTNYQEINSGSCSYGSVISDWVMTLTV